MAGLCFLFFFAIALFAHPRPPTILIDDVSNFLLRLDHSIHHAHSGIYFLDVQFHHLFDIACLKSSSMFHICKAFLDARFAYFFAVDFYSSVVTTITRERVLFTQGKYTKSQCLGSSSHNIGTTPGMVIMRPPIRRRPFRFR